MPPAALDFGGLFFPEKSTPGSPPQRLLRRHFRPCRFERKQLGDLGIRNCLGREDRHVMLNKRPILRCRSGAHCCACPGFRVALLGACPVLSGTSVSSLELRLFTCLQTCTRAVL